MKEISESIELEMRGHAKDMRTGKWLRRDGQTAINGSDAEMRGLEHKCKQTLYSESHNDCSILKYSSVHLL